MPISPDEQLKRFGMGGFSGTNPILDAMRVMAASGLNPAGVPGSGGHKLWGTNTPVFSGMPMGFTHPSIAMGPAENAEYGRFLHEHHLSPDMVDPSGEIHA